MSYRLDIHCNIYSGETCQQQQCTVIYTVERRVNNNNALLYIQWRDVSTTTIIDCR